jgi:hypothetical protein
MRAARAYAVGIALSMVLFVALVPGQNRDLVASRSIREGLVSASWIVAGLSALAAARDFGAPRRYLHAAFTFARGVSVQDELRARLLATALRIALGVFFPSLAIVTVSWLTGAVGFAWGGVWLACGLVYALALGGLLSLLAVGCSRVTLQNARGLLLVVVVVPELLRQAGLRALPTLPAACAWAIEQAATLSKAIG